MSVKDQSWYDDGLSPTMWSVLRRLHAGEMVAADSRNHMVLAALERRKLAECLGWWTITQAGRDKIAANGQVTK
jgi:hypothetical protein